MLQLLQRAQQLHPEALHSQHSHDVGGEAVAQAMKQADPKPRHRTRQRAARLANLEKARAARAALRKRRSMKDCTMDTAGELTMVACLWLRAGSHWAMMQFCCMMQRCVVM